jgi:hypothetical protein
MSLTLPTLPAISLLASYLSCLTAACRPVYASGPLDAIAARLLSDDLLRAFIDPRVRTHALFVPAAAPPAEEGPAEAAALQQQGTAARPAEPAWEPADGSDGGAETAPRVSLAAHVWAGGDALPAPPALAAQPTAPRVESVPPAVAAGGVHAAVSTPARDAVRRSAVHAAQSALGGWDFARCAHSFSCRSMD